MTTVLEAMEQRERVAAPGPWEVTLETIEPCEDEIKMYTIWSARNKRGSRWSVADSGNPQMAAFIAAARSDIPLLLAVARAAAEIVRHMTPIEHPKAPTDYAHGWVTNEEWRALVAATMPLMREVTE